MFCNNWSSVSECKHHPHLIVFSSSFEEFTGAESPRKMILKKQRREMIEGIGPLQTIYKLPHDEVLILDNYNVICKHAIILTHLIYPYACRLFTKVTPVLWRGVSCTMAVCTSPNGICASTLTYSPNN